MRGKAHVLALRWYVDHGQPLPDAMRRLNPSQLGDFYLKERTAWYPLDTAAKVYPLSMIDLLSKKCGLGTGRYRFDGSVARTATEVISEQSDLYQSLKRNEKPLERAVLGMVNALSWLDGGPAEVKASVAFDDSIIEDVGATVERTLRLVTNGLKSKKRAIMEMYRCTEADAEAMLAEVAREARGDYGALGAADAVNSADAPAEG